MIIRCCASIIIGVAACTVCALAASAPVILPNTPVILPNTVGSQFNYHIDFSGAFWNGQKRQFSRDVRLRVTDVAAVSVNVLSSRTDSSLVGQGILKKDGTIVGDRVADTVSSYNTMVRLLANAPATMKDGDTWSATISVRTFQREPQAGAPGSKDVVRGQPEQFEFTDLPVTVTLASAGAGNYVFKASGAKSFSTTYQTYDVPIDLEVRIAIRFTSGHFDRCEYAGSEVVHAGPQTQTMTWKYSVIPGGQQS